MQLRFAKESPTDKAPLSDLSNVLEKARIHSGIPGMSVAILYKGEIIFAEGFGKRNNHNPFTPETLMPIASITKPFTATAVGELVAEGKMDWDSTPVSKYLPEFELEDPYLTATLTMADLLSHRSGFPPYDLAWFRNTESRRDLIKRMKHVKLDTKLRSDCQYNNLMYAVAGEAAANAAGMSYEELVRTKVLEPLGLTSTGFSPTEMRERGSNYAMPYMAASFEDAQKGKLVEGYLDEIYMADAPAGDLYSNVFDLVRWGRVIMQSGLVDGEQILNKESVEETKSGYTFMNKKRRTQEFPPTLAYGLGWMLDGYKGQIVYRHAGSTPGFRSNLAFFPDADLVIAHLANVDVAELLANLPYYIADELLGFPKTQDWINDVTVKASQRLYAQKESFAAGSFPEVQDKPPTRPLHEFVGHYTHPFWGEISIRMGKEKDSVDKELYFNMRSFDSKITPYHCDTFRTQLHDFVANFAALLTFRTGRDGQVSRLQLSVAGVVLDFERMTSSS